MGEDIQQKTTINIQEKANLIWAIADKLVGVYKPHEYGNVILPMCVIKRFEDTLTPTKQAVLDTNAKADTLIKGSNADNMRQGDTLGDDKFPDYKFDYIISNPPFGIEWKTSKKAVEDEHLLGEAGRFAPGLPAIGDGQMLFLLNGVAKLKEDEGRMAIIQNGSSLFKGERVGAARKRVYDQIIGMSKGNKTIDKY